MISRRKGVDCLGKGEIASWRTQEIPGEIPRQLITWVMAKRAPARNFRTRVFPEVFPMTAPAIPALAPKGRLGNGQLRRQVAAPPCSRDRPARARRAWSRRPSPT